MKMRTAAAAPCICWTKDWSRCRPAILGPARKCMLRMPTSKSGRYPRHARCVRGLNDVCLRVEARLPLAFLASHTAERVSGPPNAIVGDLFTSRGRRVAEQHAGARRTEFSKIPSHFNPVWMQKAAEHGRHLAGHHDGAG